MIPSNLLSTIADDDCPTEIRDFVRSILEIEITQYVQRGFNGEVYFGKHTKLGEEVVIKFYFGFAKYNETEEAVILRRISHENVLKIHDLRFVPPYYPCFISPKISGGDLQGVLESRAISSQKALEIIAGILNGVSHLHSQHSLLHRDLKPGNILVDQTTLSPVVADLGSVKKFANANDPISASKSTLVYLPPESINGNQYFIQSDLYQIGIILFQLLGGHFPINHPINWLNAKEIAQVSKEKSVLAQDLKVGKIIEKRILDSKIANLDSLPPYLDKTFKRLLAKALNKDYRKRYLNAGEFLNAVHNLMRNTPDYLVDGEFLLISHRGGREFRISKVLNSNSWMMEKRINGSQWRREKPLIIAYEELLEVARKG